MNSRITSVFLLIIIVIFFLFCFSGCAGKKADDGSAPVIYRFNEVANVRNLDPAMIGDTASHHAGGQVYEGLVTFDNDLKLVPALAESWDISEDGLEYTFHLRKGVKFHDNPCFPEGKGREFTAADVKYSLERIANKKTASIGWAFFQGKVKGVNDYFEGKAEEVAGYEVIDDYTFKVTLATTFSPFINILAMSYGYVVPREAVEHYGQDFFKNPVGTGPFIFERWITDVEVSFKKNPDYWEVVNGERVPYIDGLRITYMRSEKQELFEFLSGKLEEVRVIPQADWSSIVDENLNLKPKYSKYQFKSIPRLDVGYYGILMGSKPWGENKKLRQAMNYAVDRKAIIKNIRGGRGKANNSGVLPPEIPGFNKELKGYEYNPEKAKALLAEAGYPDGKGLPELILQLNSGGGPNEDIAEAVQSFLNEIGLKVSLRVMDWPIHLKMMENGETEFFRIGWLADYPDPENFLSLLYSRNMSPLGPNYTKYSNPEFDKLFEAALKETDDEKRFKLYQDAERLVVEDAPWLFLQFGQIDRLVQPYVENYPLNAMDYPNYKYVKINK